MRQGQELLSLSAFHVELGHVGNERQTKALKDSIDIARLPTSKSTLPTYWKGNLAMSNLTLNFVAKAQLCPCDG
jgi:hypothetical protein